MISPQDFIAGWGTSGIPLVRYSMQAVERLVLDDEEKAFLREVGLPRDAAPFLTFKAPKTGELPTVADQWSLGQEFQRYHAIGSDGSGNPIALDNRELGEIVLLDHENRFARVFVNKSVRQLAESLVAYRKLVERTLAEFGEDAFLDGRISSENRLQLSDELAKIDPAAMQPSGFWTNQIQILNANAASPL